MPNHVSNLIAFPQDVSEYLCDPETGGVKKVSVFDEKIISMKLAFLLINSLESGSADYQDFLEKTILEHDVVQIILDDFDKMDKEQLRKIYENYSKAEVFMNDFLKERSFDEILELLSNNYCNVSILDDVVYNPVSFEAFVSGYNATLAGVLIDKGVIVDDKFLCKDGNSLALDSGYNIYRNHYGTKWGTYGHSFECSEFHFETAWSPLNEKSMSLLVNHLYKITGIVPEFFVCGEQGMGFCAYIEFALDDDDESHVAFSETEEGDLIIEWDEETDEMGDVSGCKYIERLAPYGYGG